jgi:acyl-CoA reductase-like NAD-dependent aldehyde dehydrogenase
MKMFVAGQRVEGSETLEVINPYDGSVLDTVPDASQYDVDQALSAATRGARVMAELSPYERYEILLRAATLLGERIDSFAQTITREEGKSLKEATTEVKRSVETLTLSAEEAKRLYGESIPLDAASTGKGKMGFTLRMPCGVVAAITPFNFPLNLVVHKVGPALAAGNAVVIKPATDTPLSALALTELLLEAGVPDEALSCLTGHGSTVGEALCRDPRVRKISFTGSRDVGKKITRTAGLKKITMELGSNCPLIVMPDADLSRVAQIVARTGYANAGQVCISTQRLLADRQIYDELVKETARAVESLVVGNPMDEKVDMGPLIRKQDAERVAEVVDEAVSEGAQVVTGGIRDGAFYVPTVVTDVKNNMRLAREELFGPAVAVTSFRNADEAIAWANASEYGLSAGVFTENVGTAMKFARELQTGNVHINWGPQWRVDLMPYGGVKGSGFGKEGPRYTVEEMTELKMVVLHQIP